MLLQQGLFLFLVLLLLMFYCYIKTIEDPILGSREDELNMVGVERVGKQEEAEYGIIFTTYSDEICLPSWKEEVRLLFSTGRSGTTEETI